MYRNPENSNEFIVAEETTVCFVDQVGEIIWTGDSDTYPDQAIKIGKGLGYEVKQCKVKIVLTAILGQFYSVELQNYKLRREVELL